MPESPSVSRRTFLSAGATLLASFGATVVLPDAAGASAATAAPPPPTPRAPTWRCTVR